MRRFVILVFLGLPYGVGLLVDLYTNEMVMEVKIPVFMVGYFIAAVVIDFQVYQPYLHAKEDFQKNIIRILLQASLDKYKEIRPGSYHIRANVMKVRKTFIYYDRKIHLRPKRYLRIDISSDGYTDAELELIYLDDVGCCGTALKSNGQVIFDPINSRELEKGMTDTMKLATVDVQSVLSTPIYKKGDLTRKPIAIFSIDSIDSSVDENGLDQDDLASMAEQYAGLIGGILS